MISKIKTLAVLLLIWNSGFGQIPILNSNPSITNKVIYLDFDGQVVSGTAWNSGNTINAAASTLSNANKIVVWQRVSEDYRPFDVNITTDSMRFNAAPANKRIRVVITTTSAWYTSPAGGVAYVGSFTWGGSPGTPCWIFENQLGYSAKNVAEACAHEIGHTLTLKHQSTYNSTCSKTAEYNPGLGTGVTSWAPIMGVGYSKNVTIWHTGTSTNGCNVIQADHGNSGTGITSPGYLSFLPDDVGNTFGTGKILNLNTTSLVDSGLITQPTDLDAFQFTICNNRYVSINVKPWALDTVNYQGANLDVRLMLYNAANSLIAVDTPLTKLNALVGANLTPGTYYFTIDGGRSSNYNDYGSLGKYFISMKSTNAPQLANTILTNSIICSGQTTTLSYSSNGTPTQWQWTISGPSATTFTTQNPTIAFSSGIHTISLLATSSASQSCPTTITLNIGSLPTVSLSSYANILCPGRSMTLTATGAPSYTWMPGAFSGSTQILYPFVTTTYTVYGSNGTCINSAMSTLSVAPDFTVAAAPSSTNVCPGKSVTITASGASSFTLNPGNITSFPYIFTPTVGNMYVIVGQSGSCTKSKSFSVSVTPHFTFSVYRSDSVICAGQSATLSSSGAISYTYNPGGLTGANVIVNPSSSTVYTVTGRGANQCREDTTISIDVVDCTLTGMAKQQSDALIHVYPNPAKGLLNIEVDLAPSKIEIMSLAGQVVYTNEQPERSNQVQLQQWSPGIYFVKLYRDKDSVLIEKIIVE